MIWRVNITIKDDKGQRSIHSFHLPYTDLETITEARQNPVAYVEAYALALGDIITGQIERIGLTLTLDIPSGLRPTPDPASDVEEGAKVVFQTVEGTYSTMRVPTFREMFVNPDGSLAAATEVVAWQELITQPEELPANWSLGPCDNRGADIVAVRRAGESFTSSRGE